LARAGYKVWCDVTRLLCEVIEDALRNRIAKFVFVSSRVSQMKDGAQKELLLADIVKKRTGLKYFILPVAIDDLPVSDSNIEILRLNVALFRGGWCCRAGWMVGIRSGWLLATRIPGVVRAGSRWPPPAWWGREQWRDGVGASDEAELVGWVGRR